MIVRIHATADALGRAAADEAAAELATALARGGEASLVVATGLSQAATLAALASRQDLAWDRITVFHLDEYVGLTAEHPAAFRRYIHERFLTRLPRPPAAFHAIAAEGDAAAECRRLAAVVPRGPFDVVLAVIGENAHLAFNDPPADFTAATPYLVVALDEACRRQQVGEGWFPSLADVPTRAVPISLPPMALISLPCRKRRMIGCLPSWARSRPSPTPWITTPSSGVTGRKPPKSSARCSRLTTRASTSSTARAQIAVIPRAISPPLMRSWPRKKPPAKSLCRSL